MAAVKNKRRLFVRLGAFMRKNPFAAGVFGLVLSAFSIYLFAAGSGVLFYVLSFCLGLLGLTCFYIMSLSFNFRLK